MTGTVISMCQPYSCSKNEELDVFFHDDHADNFSDYVKTLMGCSHCFYTDSDSPEMVCAFTLSHSALHVNSLPKNVKRKLNKKIPYVKQKSAYPALLIGRLCVFDGFDHMGIGDELLNVIKSMALDPDNNSACRYLLIDALNVPKVIQFYQRNGFEFVYKTEEQEFLSLHSRETSWFGKFKAYFKSRTVRKNYSCKTRLMLFDLILLGGQ